jgi:hypothetical protein
VINSTTVDYVSMQKLLQVGGSNLAGGGPLKTHYEVCLVKFLTFEADVCADPGNFSYLAEVCITVWTISCSIIFFCIQTICKGNPVVLRKSLSLAGGNSKMNISGYNT